MQRLLPKLGALAACVYLGAGCGSSPASNFYDLASGGSNQASAGAGATTASGGSSNSAGTSALGGGGAFASGGQASNGGAGGNPSDAPCHPVMDVSGGASGPLGTFGAACLRVTGDIMGWGCSNFEGRTVKVNGRLVMCAQLPLPDKIDGAYYFDVSPGTFDYASFYWF